MPFSYFIIYFLTVHTQYDLLAVKEYALYLLMDICVYGIELTSTL